MTSLLELTPCAGLLPLDIGGVELSEVVLGRMMSVAPFAGQEKAVSARLKDGFGVGLSGTNRAVAKGDVRVQWFGHGTWLVSADVALDELAAVSDQRDAWAVVRIAGPGVEDILARLVPLDLRAVHFKNGHTARTMLGHMSVAVTRAGARAFEIMAMRSMAGTLVHELEGAMRSMAAR